MANKVREFHFKEIETSGERHDRLSQPGGPEDADLGLILHIQSEDDRIGAMWNPRSATISLLKEKGLSDAFMYCIDWHWRADAAFSGAPGCPASKWKPGLRKMHDDFSVKVLDILPLPFLITGSSCTRESLRKSLSSEARTLKLPLVHPFGVLQVDLDFRQRTLRRIIAHIHHPISGFFVGRDRRIAMAEQIDGGLDIMLWLTGRPFVPKVFSKHYSISRGSRSSYAPLQEMWAYVRLEQNTQLLKLEDYSSTFLSWAGRYLCQDPAKIIANGASVAGTAALHIRKRMSIARRKRSSRSKCDADVDDICSSISLTETLVAPSNELIQADTLEQVRSRLLQSPPCSMEDLQGTTAILKKRGRVKIGSYSKNVLEFSTGTKAIKKILDSGAQVCVHFTGNEIQLKNDDEVVYTKPYERLLVSANGAEWLVQLAYQQTIANADRTSTSDKRQSLDLENNARLTSVRDHWKNPELRNRLLRGYAFPCTKSQHGVHQSYRIYFRGVGLYVPNDARPDSIFLQCFLAEEGCVHEFRCVNGEDGDPARRLGIQLSYTNALTNERRQIWLKQRGDGNICKLNSLVDFLEEKPIEWTEKQARRFLDRNIAGGRSHVSYTSVHRAEEDYNVHSIK